MRSQKRDYNIGILSKYSGVNIETIRNYEKIKIMPSLRWIAYSLSPFYKVKK